jgi:hypothetical protein
VETAVAVAAVRRREGLHGHDANFPTARSPTLFGGRKGTVR